MITFWQYLKKNGVFFLIGWTALLTCFIAYWLIAYGWEDSKNDIIWSLLITTGVWIVYIIRDIFTYKQL